MNSKSQEFNFELRVEKTVIRDSLKGAVRDYLLKGLIYQTPTPRLDNDFFTNLLTLFFLTSGRRGGKENCRCKKIRL